MVLGLLLLGWIGGFAAATVHLTTLDGSWLGALGMFVGVSTCVVLLTAAQGALRMELRERRRHALALCAPVPPFAPDRRPSQNRSPLA